MQDLTQEQERAFDTFVDIETNFLLATDYPPLEPCQVMEALAELSAENAEFISLYLNNGMTDSLGGFIRIAILGYWTGVAKKIAISRAEEKFGFTIK